MSKRPNSQASKRSSTFASLIQAHQEPKGAGESTAAAMPAVGATRGKSANPDYVKLTSYIRRETHRAVKKRLLDEGREISELVEELMGGWLRGDHGRT
jgi:hypothetical protein